MPLRLPSKLDLGLAVIRVKLVTIKEMRLVSECDEDDSTPDGLWDPEDDTIYILKKLSPYLKRRAYYHEIKHAVNDCDYWGEVG